MECRSTWVLSTVLFIIFLNDLGDGTESLSKAADESNGGKVIDAPAVTQRDLIKLEKEPHEVQHGQPCYSVPGKVLPHAPAWVGDQPVRK